MPALRVHTALAPLALVAGLAACASAATAEHFAVGDCLKIGGTVDRPEATGAACGSTDSTFKVVAVVDTSDQCPADADSSYSMSGALRGRATVCMDVDWVVGGCMRVDPDGGDDPVRVDCADTAVPNRQRATQILTGVADVNQCASGQGYAYDERQYLVCVEDVN